MLGHSSVRAGIVATMVLASGAAGFLLSRATTPRARPPARVAPIESVSASAPAGQDANVMASIESLRAEVRMLTELVRDDRKANQDPAAPSPASSGEGPQPERSAEPAPEQRAAYDKAHDRVESAIRAGYWTRNDAVALRSEMRSLSPAQADEIRSSLFTAANSQRLKMEFRGAPL